MIFMTLSEPLLTFRRINGVVVTWVVATVSGVDPPGVRFPLNAK